MSENDTKYFADKEAKETANILLSRATGWYNELDTNGYLDKLRTMWAAYHGAYFSSFSDGHSITFGGEQGEITQIAVNHIRNFATIMLNMITATRPAMKARAINSDPKSLSQARLANGLLDYYLRQKRLEDYLRKAVEYAIVFGSGYIKMEWNATSGQIYDYTPDEFELDELGEQLLDEAGEPKIKRKGFPIYEGDVQFSNLDPFNVVFDINREDHDHDWIMVRTFKNRFDLIAKYPELSEEILASPTKDQLDSQFLSAFSYDDTDLVPVYEFYHKQTEAMPEGRLLYFVSPEAVLFDSGLPYRDLPVFRISAGDVLGTPLGYTSLFDILPIQDAMNSLYSTVLSNQTAFGVQSIIAPKNADVTIEQLSSGLNLIEANLQFGKVEALQLTQTAPEIFENLKLLERLSETISGINSVSRGNPDPRLRSGNALALVQSMTLQYMSGLQQSYVRLVETVGTSLIRMLRDFAAVPRIAAISGVRNASQMKEFVGDDLDKIDRVFVDIGNPLANSTAGRVEMAEQLLQMGLIKSPEQYFTVLNTGSLEAMTEEHEFEALTIKRENEFLLEGRDVVAIITDDHASHIKAHKGVLADPELRLDADLLARTTAHIQEHIDLLRTVDPDLLKIIGEQPLAPRGGMPANQPNQAPPANSMEQQIPEALATPQVGGQMPQMPNLPTPPPPFQSLPVDPSQIPQQ